MVKIVVTEFVSPDGVREDPGGAEKTEYGGWTLPSWNDEIGAFTFAELFARDAMVLGRTTSPAWFCRGTGGLKRASSDRHGGRYRAGRYERGIR